MRFIIEDTEQYQRENFCCVCGHAGVYLRANLVYCTEHFDAVNKPHKRVVAVQEPSVGRIVHYRDQAGVCLAAIITRLHNNQTVDLVIFSTDVFRSGGYIECKEGGETQQWHWPEVKGS